MEQLRNCHRKAHEQEQRKGMVEGCIKMEWIYRGDHIKQCMYGKLG